MVNPLVKNNKIWYFIKNNKSKLKDIVLFNLLVNDSIPYFLITFLNIHKFKYLISNFFQSYIISIDKVKFLL